MKWNLTVKNNPLQHRLPRWYQSRVGQAFLQQEQAVIDEFLPSLFGYHLLQLSVCDRLSLYEKSKIRHRFTFARNPKAAAHAITDERLPLQSESVDVSLLHHVLECSDDPHYLLREVARITVPSGYVLITGFNARGVLAGRYLQQSISKQAVLPAPLSLKRLKDWLEILDFSVQSVRYGYYRLPYPVLQNLPLWLENYLQRRFAPIGGFYCVLAKKEVSRLTPIYLSADKRRSIAVDAAQVCRKSNHKTKESYDRSNRS